jgi:acetyl-CoA carboxylase biotin carboxyl carrier protein
MSKNTIDSDLVRQLASLLDETGLAEIEIEKEDFKIRVAKAKVQQVTEAVAYASSGAPLVPPAAVAEPAEITASHPNAVVSPMVGNVYLAGKPSTPPFVQVGDTVSAGQTLLIIEAMKVMNPIPAPKSGVVKRILVEDSQPIEYNEVMMLIE